MMGDGKEQRQKKTNCYKGGKAANPDQWRVPESQTSVRAAEKKLRAEDPDILSLELGPLLLATGSLALRVLTPFNNTRSWGKLNLELLIPGVFFFAYS